MDIFSQTVDLPALAAAVVSSFVTFKMCTIYRKRNNPPSGAVMADRIPGLAGYILGWLAPLDSNPSCEHLLTETQRLSNNKAVYFTSLFGGVLIPTTLQDILHIANNPKTYIKGNEYPKALGPIFGYTGIIVLTDDDYHTIVRRKLGPTFSAPVSAGIADNLMSRFVSSSLDGLVDAGEEKTIHMSDVMVQYALAVIQDAAFRPEMAHKVMPNGKKIGEITGSMVQDIPLTWYQFLPGGTKIPTQRRRQLLQNQRYVADALHELTERLAEDPPPKSEWLLIDRVIGCGLSDQEIFDNLMTFLFAGYETTATTLGWLCYELAVNPDVQEKLFEELEQVVPADGVASIQALKSCQYLDAVMNESLRLHPPVLLVPRISTEDDVLPSGVVVPKGSQLNAFIAYIQQHPPIWGDDAHKYRPERWFDMTRDQQSAFMPFWTGKRNCIGKEFAMNEQRMIISTLVRRYSMRWPEGTRAPKRKPLLTAYPDIPVDVLMRKR